MIKRFLVFIAVILSVVLAAGTASAVLVTADLASVNPGTGVSVTYTGGTPTYSGSPEAGNYLVNITGYGSNISGFCIDPAEASVGILQNYNLVSIASQTLTSAQQTALTEAAWILAHYPGPGGTNAVAAQVAVWSIVWPALGGGTFSSGASDNGIAAAAVSAVALGWNQDSQYSLLLSPGDQLLVTDASGSQSFGNVYQDYIVPIPLTVTTPLPAAVWLLGSGLMGLVGIRRRLRKK